MGSYLSQPVTEKISSDEVNDKLNCGASSMQGWRESQEDAHNCILDYDENTSLFAVFDGHGGHEVALYCSQNLPQNIKNTVAYKENDLSKALVDSFLSFDATIATSKVVAILKEIAGTKEAEESSDEENVNNLYEEASMPIEQVMEKYAANLVNKNIKDLKDKQAPVSPYLNAKKDSDSDVSTSGSIISASTSQKATEQSNDDVTSSSNIISAQADVTSNVENEDKIENGPCSIPKITVDSPDSSDSKKVNSSTDEAELKADDQPNQNGEVSISEENKNDVTSSSGSLENGEINKKGKGKALAKTKGVKTPTLNTRPKRTATQLYKKLLDFEESEESEDEEDQTFDSPIEISSDEDGDCIKDSSIVDDSESSDEEDDEEEEEDEECPDGDDDDEDEEERSMRDEPGFESGCTAVVALLRGKELYVANAGDSRCIVCRNGKAVEMSLDHKPEDEPEKERIIKAGGFVTMDGRVNGGLNLSRAIGDHAYKQNKDLSDREQMITALPDIRTLTINPNEDEFMVLACDGIWNFMSSQEVVDFVSSRLQEGREKLSQICEEMFDHCLAPNTFGDGTGCDNMTAIIVQFKKSMLKRSSSSECISTEKRAKTDTSEAHIDTTV